MRAASWGNSADRMAAAASNEDSGHWLGWSRIDGGTSKNANVGESKEVNSKRLTGGREAVSSSTENCRGWQASKEESEPASSSGPVAVSADPDCLAESGDHSPVCSDSSATAYGPHCWARVHTHEWKASREAAGNYVTRSE